MTNKFKHPPLKTELKLRTAGLASEKSATFGMVRNGGKRAHQGVDLAVDNDYWVYAVEDGEIVSLAKGKNGYGFTITLKVSNGPLAGKYVFYAHLDRIDCAVGQVVTAGIRLGLTGDTGNAAGMETVSEGAHLHLELRTKMYAGLGLTGRLDPLPYLAL